MEGLVWSIDFGRTISPDDALTDGGYTVDIPPQPLGGRLRYNGKPVEEPKRVQAAAPPTDPASQASVNVAGASPTAAAKNDKSATDSSGEMREPTGDSGKQKPDEQ